MKKDKELYKVPLFFSLEQNNGVLPETLKLYSKGGAEFTLSPSVNGRYTANFVSVLNGQSFLIQSGQQHNLESLVRSGVYSLSPDKPCLEIHFEENEIFI